MLHIRHLSSIVLLTVTVSLGSAQKAPKDAPPPTPAPKAAKPAAAPKGGGQPKAVPKGAGTLVNPGAVVTKLYGMTPEQRDRILEQLPPAMQERFRKNLAWFDGLAKEQQEMQIRRMQRIEQLSPEKKAEIQALIQSANQLPPARRNLVGRTIFLLQQLSDQQRENRLHLPQFQERFTPEELHIITVLSDVWTGPPQGPKP